MLKILEGRNVFVKTPNGVFKGRISQILIGYLQLSGDDQYKILGRDDDKIETICGDDCVIEENK